MPIFQYYSKRRQPHNWGIDWLTDNDNGTDSILFSSSSSSTIVTDLFLLSPPPKKEILPEYYEIAHCQDYWDEYGRIWRRKEWSACVPHPIEGFWRERKLKIPFCHYMDSRKYHSLGKNIFEGIPKRLKKRMIKNLNPQIKHIPTKKAFWRWR